MDEPCIEWSPLASEVVEESDSRVPWNRERPQAPEPIAPPHPAPRYSQQPTVLPVPPSELMHPAKASHAATTKREAEENIPASVPAGRSQRPKLTLLTLNGIVLASGLLALWASDDDDDDDHVTGSVRQSKHEPLLWAAIALLAASAAPLPAERAFRRLCNRREVPLQLTIDGSPPPQLALEQFAVPSEQIVAALAPVSSEDSWSPPPLPRAEALEQAFHDKMYATTERVYDKVDQLIDFPIKLRADRPRTRVQPAAAEEIDFLGHPLDGEAPDAAAGATPTLVVDPSTDGAAVHHVSRADVRLRALRRCDGPPPAAVQSDEGHAEERVTEQYLPGPDPACKSSVHATRNVVRAAIRLQGTKTRTPSPRLSPVPTTAEENQLVEQAAPAAAEIHLLTTEVRAVAQESGPMVVAKAPAAAPEVPHPVMAENPAASEESQQMLEADTAAEESGQAEMVENGPVAAQEPELLLVEAPAAAEQPEPLVVEVALAAAVEESHQVILEAPASAEEPQPVVIEAAAAAEEPQPKMIEALATAEESQIVVVLASAAAEEAQPVVVEAPASAEEPPLVVVVTEAPVATEEESQRVVDAPTAVVEPKPVEQAWVGAATTVQEEPQLVAVEASVAAPTAAGRAEAPETDDSVGVEPDIVPAAVKPKKKKKTQAERMAEMSTPRIRDERIKPGCHVYKPPVRGLAYRGTEKMAMFQERRDGGMTYKHREQNEDGEVKLRLRETRGNEKLVLSHGVVEGAARQRAIESASGICKSCSTASAASSCHGAAGPSAPSLQTKRKAVPAGPKAKR